MAGNAGVSDNQEVQDVLQYYLNLFKNEYSPNILDSFAANCVIDWFGVSVRRKQKLNEFLRYEIKAQLNHADFNDASACEPIEVKPLHMTTKSFASNFTKKIQIDSDTEDDEEAITSNAMEISPNSSLGIAPLPTEECSSEAVDDGCWLNKRHKRALPTIETKRCKKDTDDEVAVAAAAADNYSSLQYLETRGRLQNLTSSEYDRNVRLSISYRRHLLDNSVQFALIIYDKLQENGEVLKIPHRKLNFDVNEAAEDDEQEECLESALTRPTTPLNTTADLTEGEANLDAFLALRTPTKVSTNPPATPRRRRRDLTSQHLKRSYTAGPSFMSTDPETPRRPAKKCNAARTLRL